MGPRRPAWPGIFLSAVSRIVPRSRRAEWLAEWRAEVVHAVLRGRRREPEERLRVHLVRNVVGAVVDALWLRLRGGGDPGWLGAVRDATRSLRRRPRFATSIVVTLALGVGAATAIFTVVDGLMLEPIPFEGADRLVSVDGHGGGLTVRAEEIAAVRAEGDRLFDATAAYAPRSLVMTGAGEARSGLGWYVEPHFLGLLGIEPALGRALTPRDAEAGHDRVVLVSDEVWRQAFAGAPDVAGRRVELDGEPFTVIGVLPPTLRRLPLGLVHFVVPSSGEEEVLDRTSLLARLREGVSLDVARERMRELARALDETHPRESNRTLDLLPVRRNLSDDVSRGLWALSAAVLCLLLVACVNAAGLLLVRGATRVPELALRRALGSSRGQIVRHVLLESLLLAIAAGLVGVLLAWIAVEGILLMLPSHLSRFSYTPVTLDGRVLLFALGLSAVTVLLSGLLPALQAGRAGAARAGRSSSVSRRDVKLRTGIQVAQLALAVVLLTGAALFGRSFQELMNVPLGYDPDGILLLELVSLERIRGEPERSVEFARELDARLTALPSVADVGRVGSGLHQDVSVAPADDPDRARTLDLLLNLSVNPGYFAAMGIELAEGRPFRSGDGETGSVAIVNLDLADALWPGRSAVGRVLLVRDQPLTVVGVTEDVKPEGPNDPYGPWLVFYPSTPDRLRSGTIVIRTSGDPRALIGPVRALVRELDPQQPIASLHTGRQALGDAVADPRLLLVLMVSFATVAALLGGIGVFGLVSFAVVQRTREIGVRRALGAEEGRVVREVLASGVGIGLSGVAIGLAASVVLTRFVRSLLFGISPLDPVALTGAGLALIAVCSIATLPPARRAARVHPSQALRLE
jgi:putative ABC transport system permease protein